MKILKATVLFLIFSLLVHTQSFSQIIAPTGITSRATSQLVFYYDNYANDPFVQITNTDDTTGVWIHVQIFRSNDDSATEVPIICDERDFIDFLTPNDTHMYDLGIANFPKNTGEAETTPGELTSVDLSEPDNTAGFILITPVVSEADLSAISFQHLIGSATDESFGYRLNAMGRDAVDFTTGEILPDGTVLDGVTGGLVVIQPEELLFDFLTFSSTEEADVIGIAFQDNYGAPGLLGYNVTPASATWTSFIFDFKEDPTSCGNRNVNCFLSIGLNDTITENSEVVDGGTSDDFVLCSGAETPDSSSDFNNPVGWTRIFVSGLGDFVSHFGIYSDAADVEGADHMFARGSRTEINPPPTDEICDDEAMADEDGTVLQTALIRTVQQQQTVKRAKVSVQTKWTMIMTGRQTVLTSVVTGSTIANLEQRRSVTTV